MGEVFEVIRELIWEKSFLTLKAGQMIEMALPAFLIMIVMIMALII